MFRSIFLTKNMKSIIKKVEEKVLKKPIMLGMIYLCGVSSVSLFTMRNINRTSNEYYESIIFVG